MYNIIGKVKKKKSTHRKSCFPIFCLLFDFFCLFSDCWWDEIFRLFLISTFLFCFVLLFLFFHPISDLCKKKKSLKKKKKTTKKRSNDEEKNKTTTQKIFVDVFFVDVKNRKVKDFDIYTFCFLLLFLLLLWFCSFFLYVCVERKRRKI